MDEHLPELLTARDVAKLLHIRVSTLYEAVARGRIPVVRLWKGRRRTLLRFHRNEIERFIHERSIPSARDPEEK